MNECINLETRKASVGTQTAKRIDKTYCCSFCPKTFLNYGLLNKHVSGHERNACKQCNETFSTRKLLVSHLSESHNDHPQIKDFKCPFCAREFAQKRSLYHHYKLKHSDLGTYCLDCQQFIKTDVYAKHVLSHTSNILECKMCKTTFKRMQQYTIHMKEHEKYKCDTCETCFASKQSAMKHKQDNREHRLSGLQKYTCDHCKRLFTNLLNLKKHIKKHKDETFICLICDITFAKKLYYDRHLMSSAHQEILGFSEKCPECDKVFSSKSLVDIHHLKVHSPRESLFCNLCNYNTKSSYNLKRHMKFHTEEYDYMCDKCPELFHTRSALSDHMNTIHSNVPRFICEICAKTFKLLSELQRHLKVHSNERSLFCYCGKTYKFSCNLRRHQKKCKLIPDDVLEQCESMMNMRKCDEMKELRNDYMAHSIFTDEYWIPSVNSEIISDVQEAEGILRKIANENDSGNSSTMELNPPIEESLITDLGDISDLPLKQDVVDTLQQSIKDTLDDSTVPFFYDIAD